MTQKFRQYLTHSLRSRLETNWDEVLRCASKCRRTWGMGFPVISTTLLRDYHVQLLQHIADVLAESRKAQCHWCAEDVPVRWWNEESPDNAWLAHYNRHSDLGENVGSCRAWTIYEIENTLRERARRMA